MSLHLNFISSFSLSRNNATITRELLGAVFFSNWLAVVNSLRYCIWKWPGSQPASMNDSISVDSKEYNHHNNILNTFNASEKVIVCSLCFIARVCSTKYVLQRQNLDAYLSDIRLCVCDRLCAFFSKYRISYVPLRSATYDEHEHKSKPLGGAATLYVQALQCHMHATCRRAWACAMGPWRKTVNKIECTCGKHQKINADIIKSIIIIFVVTLRVRRRSQSAQCDRVRCCLGEIDLLWATNELKFLSDQENACESMPVPRVCCTVNDIQCWIQAPTSRNAIRRRWCNDEESPCSFSYFCEIQFDSDSVHTHTNWQNTQNDKRSCGIQKWHMCVCVCPAQCIVK